MLNKMLIVIGPFKGNFNRPIRVHQHYAKTIHQIAMRIVSLKMIPTPTDSPQKNRVRKKNRAR